MFLQVFDLFVWLALLLVYILIRGLVYLHHRYQRKRFIKVIDFRLSTLTIYGLLINQPVSSSDVQRSKFLKFLVIVLLFASVWCATAYSSRLSSIMVTPMYVPISISNTKFLRIIFRLENNIDTLKELADSNLKLLFFDRYEHPLAADQRVCCLL